MDSWDQRDIEMGSRDKMAILVAEITSGVPGATPMLEDYSLADALRRIIENALTEY